MMANRAGVGGASWLCVGTSPIVWTFWKAGAYNTVAMFAVFGPLWTGTYIVFAADEPESG